MALISAEPSVNNQEKHHFIWIKRLGLKQQTTSRFLLTPPPTKESKVPVKKEYRGCFARKA